MANYLVTGGTGQIGSFLCDELAEEGHKVVCLDFKPNMDNVSQIADKITVVTGDVENLGELADLVKRHSIDRIIHLAAFLVFDSKARPSKAYQVNIMGTNNVLEAARLLDVNKTVLASSVSVYGDIRPRRPGVVDEQDYLNTPFDPYSTSKIANELMGRFYRENYGLDLTCLRVTAAWGPRRYSGYTGRFNEVIRKAAIGEDTDVPEDFSYREMRLKWLYVKDAGHGFSFASKVKGKSSSYLYNLGSKEAFGWRELVQALKEVCPERKIGIRELEKPTAMSMTVAGPNGLDVDCSLIYDEMGFKPQFTLRSAVKDMVRYERARLRIPSC